MSTPRPRPAHYTIGQAVQVEAPDFTRPGFPVVWQDGVVEALAALDSGHLDVRVRMLDGRARVERVGKRGGNRRLRAA
jgi:hypothetical protein